jgi:peptidoglycan/LPS O-acetylase OafA/YrhL
MTHMLVLRFADMHQIDYTLPIAVQFAGVCAVAAAISICLFLYIERPSRLMLKRTFRTASEG